MTASSTTIFNLKICLMMNRAFKIYSVLVTLLVTPFEINLLDLKYVCPATALRSSRENGEPASQRTIGLKF